jgi:tripartite-type tricarboxylate transporter receptor subunit TctC
MRRIVYLALALSAVPAFAADNYPNRPIRLVIATATGGAQDANGRTLARQVEAQMGQSFVIDNRAGANGIIGYDIVAKALPDGYTLLNTSVAFIINPSVYKTLPFDVSRDYAPITNYVVGQGALLVVHPSVAARNVKELIALARERQLSYSSPGIGNGLHLLSAAFSVQAGVNMLHVPYKGAGPALTAVLGGEVQTMFVSPPPSVQHVKSGRLRALGYSGRTRLEALPELPTIAEGGLPGYQLDTGWHAWFAPARTPAPILARLHAEIEKAVQLPRLRDYYVNNGFLPTAEPPPQFEKTFRADIKRWGDIARAAKIEAQ